MLLHVSCELYVFLLIYNNMTEIVILLDSGIDLI